MSPLSFRPKLTSSLSGYSRTQLGQDIGAGITVGVLALPLAMAFAIASGMSPSAGIWTAIVAGFLISAFGGSKVQIGGPTGAFIPIIFGIVATYGVQNLLIATMLAGFLLIAMGLARLGNVIRYIPIAVVIGFTNGIAVVIFLSQIKDFFGLKIDKLPADFFERVQSLVAAAPSFDLMTTLLSVASLVVLYAWNYFAKSIHWMQRLPGPLAALVFGTLVATLLHLPVETIGSRFGGIPREFPTLSFPTLTLDSLRFLIAPAITIALLGSIESLLSARVADTHIDDRHDSNQELIAQGIANVAAPLFGGFAATGAIARTATNIRSGGRTPIAGIVHALTLLVIVLVAAPLASRIPLASLAAIVVVVSINMGEWHEFRELKRYSIPYRTILLSVFLITVIFDLTLAVEIGMVLASLFFIYRMSELTRIERVPLEQYYEKSMLLDEDGKPRMAAYKFFGSLFFGAVGKLEAALSQIGEPPTVLILDMEKVVMLDTTGLDVIESLHRSTTKRGATLVLCGLNAQPQSLIKRSGFAESLGPANLTDNLADAILRAQECYRTPSTLSYA